MMARVGSEGDPDPSRWQRTLHEQTTHEREPDRDPFPGLGGYGNPPTGIRVRKVNEARNAGPRGHQSSPSGTAAARLSPFAVQRHAGLNERQRCQRAASPTESEACINQRLGVECLEDSRVTRLCRSMPEPCSPAHVRHGARDKSSVADDEAIDRRPCCSAVRPMRRRWRRSRDHRAASAPRGARRFLLFGRAPAELLALGLECIARNACTGPDHVTRSPHGRAPPQRREWCCRCPSRRRWRCAYRRAGHRLPPHPRHGRIQRGLVHRVRLDQVAHNARGGCAMPVHAWTRLWVW